ncbi:MAG: DUF1653 domain-containing protein [Rubrivivax sp.]|nr:MAG: DUF1653 domain-containing protein [Rubrivivax sp.]
MTEARPVPPLPALEPGIYRHYKGERYQVYGVARHSETFEALVVYRPLYGEGALWVRPFEMFTGAVDMDGRSVGRFVFESTGGQTPAVL